jgi:predicted phosphodiesterase
MIKLRIIGDVHGKLEDYIQLASQAEYSIQLGDLGFDYDPIKILNPIKHRVLGGNHDNYSVMDGVFHKQTSHFLGNYGVHNIPVVGDLFFVRGGHSIDKAQRTENYNWWTDEQISYSDGLKALDEYTKVKPDFMISHECPASVIEMVAGFKTWDGEEIRPSMTANLLEQMFDVHKPHLWIFGHHHKFFDMNVKGTRFICLPELACFDISPKETK